MGGSQGEERNRQRDRSRVGVRASHGSTRLVGVLRRVTFRQYLPGFGGACACVGYSGRIVAPVGWLLSLALPLLFEVRAAGTAQCA
jgi:hypothetical protein